MHVNRKIIRVDRVTAEGSRVTSSPRRRTQVVSGIIIILCYFITHRMSETYTYSV